jgi:hypothetical protein
MATMPTTTRPTFHESLALGQRAEDRIATTLYGAGWAVQRHNRDARCDLQVWIAYGRAELVECKDESRYAGSARIAVELWQGEPSRPSGLSTSEATVWVHVLGDVVALYRTAPMRLWVRTCRLPVDVFRGSDNAARGVLVPMERLRDGRWFDVADLGRLAKSRFWWA